jgi:hypothetical protein
MAEAENAIDWEKAILNPTAAKQEKPTEKVVTAEEFITSWPLNSSVRIPRFAPPERISFYCNGKCSKETTWRKEGDAQAIHDGMSKATIYSAAYMCNLCQRTNLVVIYREMSFEQIDVTSPPAAVGRPTPTPRKMMITATVMKIGQYPSQSIELPKGLEKSLGAEAAGLYKKGIICRNVGYGLGSASYIRRVVENKTNELIEVAAELAESFGVDSEVVKQMRAAADSSVYTTYEDKLKVAGTVYPDSLRVGSVNPLKVLYGLVSKGIHSLSEAECLQVFDDTVEVFDYVFTNLKAQVADRKTFMEKVKKLS